jgi:hypothetical protein
MDNKGAGQEPMEEDCGGGKGQCSVVAPVKNKYISNSLQVSISIPVERKKKMKIPSLPRIPKV